MPARFVTNQTGHELPLLWGRWTDVVRQWTIWQARPTSQAAANSGRAAVCTSYCACRLLHRTSSSRLRPTRSGTSGRTCLGPRLCMGHGLLHVRRNCGVRVSALAHRSGDLTGRTWTMHLQIDNQVRIRWWSGQRRKQNQKTLNAVEMFAQGRNGSIT